MPLAEPAVRSGDVEVAQADGAQTVGARPPGEHVVHGELARAVGVGGRGRVGLAQRRVRGRVSVGGGGGGEHQPVHAVFAHGLQQGEGAGDVGVPVRSGVLHGLAHQGLSGEVQHGVEGGVQDAGRVVDVALDEGGAGGDGVTVAGGEHVEHGDLVSHLQQECGDDAADVTGAAVTRSFTGWPLGCAGRWSRARCR